MNFGISWQKNPQPRNQWRFFRLDLSISGHFQQLWAQLAVKLPLRSQTGIFLDWIYPFQAISSNFGFSWQLSPPVGQQGFFRLDLSISGNFQQLCLQLVEKSPTQEPNREFFLDWIYPFQAISSNFGLSWQKSFPLQEPETGKFFRLDLSISGNFQQLWVQLAVKLPPRSQTGKILDWIYSFQAISSNFGFSWQLSPPVG